MLGQAEQVRYLWVFATDGGRASDAEDLLGTLADTVVQGAVGQRILGMHRERMGASSSLGQYLLRSMDAFYLLVRPAA